jgi:hypothetical protein
MNTRYLKQKGRMFQQKIRDLIIESFGLPQEDVKSCSMGAGGVDIQLSSHAKRVFPFSIECKNVKGLSALSTYYKQSVLNCVKETIPVLVCEMPDGKPLVTMSLEDFFEVVRR